MFNIFVENKFIGQKVCLKLQWAPDLLQAKKICLSEIKNYITYSMNV